VALNKAAAALVLARQQVEGSSSGISAAMALVAERQASLAAASKNAGRILTLVSRHQLSEAEGDTVRTNLKVAKASLDAAEQQLKEAEQNLGQRGEHNPQVLSAKAAYDAASLDLKHTQIVAPADGYIADFNLRPGTMIARGQDLFALIEQNEWWLDANFKETDLKRIRGGQPATFELDMYPDHTFHGTVDSISRGSGATFSLLPPENATGNWVKVTQRFTARVRVKNSPPEYPLRVGALRVGASASVTIDTTHHG
jgi:membrane fusion protein, multidrug efflux system